MSVNPMKGAAAIFIVAALCFTGCQQIPQTEKESEEAGSVQERSASENVIIIYDDVDIPLGAIRIRKAGGAGTHNGMKSVVSELGTQEFPRIRIGVGAAGSDEDLIERVIGKVPKEEQPLLDKAAADAAAAAEDIVRLGIEKAMSKHNHK